MIEGYSSSLYPNMSEKWFLLVFTGSRTQDLSVNAPAFYCFYLIVSDGVSVAWRMGIGMALKLKELDISF